MSTKRKNPKSVSAYKEPFQKNELESVPSSIRLSGKLNKEVRKAMDSSGLSLNAVVTVALADYLKERGYEVW